MAVQQRRSEPNLGLVLPTRVAHIKDKLVKAKTQVKALSEIGERMKTAPDGQVSLTDADARSMATSGRGTGMVGYNVQTVVPIVPKPLTSGSKFAGRFDKRDFVYDAYRDEYTCPAGQIAIHRFTSVEDDKTQHKYWPPACPECPIKTLPKVQTEMSLQVLACNLERVMKILGAGPLMKAMRA